MTNEQIMTEKKPGAPPGTLVYIGERRTAPVKMSVIDYDGKRHDVREITDIEQAFPYKDSSTVTWINIDGLQRVDIIEKIGNHFGIHPLVLEDILHTQHRPKLEEHDRYLFLTVKMLQYDKTASSVVVEQISLIQGTNYVISFQESRGDVFEPVRTRLRNGRVRIRESGPDYLVYALLDAIVDHYFVILEKVGERVEDLEAGLMEHPSRDDLHEIHRLKRELSLLRRSVWPLREVVAGWERSESTLIKRDTRLYLRDVYDHTIQVIDTVESQRDLVSGMLDVYLSSISNRTNDVMKLLTMIATIFIPLSFLAGLYGMNFEHMPELHTRWGYPILLAVMLTVGISMVVYFKKKDWL